MNALGRNAASLKCLLLILFLMVVAATAEAGEKKRDASWARPLHLPPVENFHQVAPGLFRAAQPSAKAFEELEKFGIVTVINLREKHSDAPLLQGTGLRLIEVPLDTWEMGDSEVITVLNLIKNEPGPILVHCKHGADRTGMMMAAYRIIFEGWSREAALEELREGGFGYHKMWINILNTLKSLIAQK